MRWYDDADGNFIEQFQQQVLINEYGSCIYSLFWLRRYSVQSEGSHSRLYLWKLSWDFCIEATTVNPTIIDGKEEHCHSITTQKILRI